MCLSSPPTGVGIVCDAHLEFIEFEGRAVADGTFDEFLRRAKECGLDELFDRVRDGYEEESPSGGVHYAVHCTEACPATRHLRTTPSTSC